MSEPLPAPLVAPAAPPPTMPRSSATLRLRQAGSLELFDRGDGDQRRPFRCRHVLPAETVTLSPMPIGDRMLRDMEVRETPTSWRHGAYQSAEGRAFEATGVILHGAAGILAASGMLFAESLGHTDPVRHRYSRDGGDVVLGFDELRPLPGTHISLLAAAAENHFHGLFDSVARLAVLTEDDLRGADGVLIPAHSCAADALAHYPLPPGLTVRQVANDETLLVDRLLLPSTVHGIIHFHPAMMRVFDAISAAIPDGDGAGPRRIYVDRRGVLARRMENEDAVVEALRPFGVEPVLVESLSFVEQVRLFRAAECVVGPHGAGLSNLAFARPGCRVVEIGIDAYLHEAFRRIAALRGLTYDCVIGRTRVPWAPGQGFEDMRWDAPLEAVTEAVRAAVA